MTRAAQHDAHVKARRRLIERIYERRIEWGSSLDRRKGETWEERHARMRAHIERQLAVFKWPKDDWGAKLSTHSPFGPKQKPIGRYADIPTRIIHSIMCTDVPESVRAEIGERP